MKPEIASAIDHIDVNLNQAGMEIINIVLALVMFGVALGIKPKTFVEVFKKPKSVIVGVISQLVLLPMLTFFLCWLMRNWISPMMALGMILVASCPGGNISNFITSLSKGNTELSVSLTAISTSAAVVLTPLNFSVWGNLYLRVAHRFTTEVPELNIPLFEVFKTIVILLGIPLVLGILCSHYFPKFAQKAKKPAQYLSVAFFVVMVVLAVNQNASAFMQCIKYIFVIVMLHNLLALCTGYTVATVAKLPFADRKTLTVETGIQNSGLGLVLLFNPNIFGPEWAANGGMLVITAWWGVWHIVSGLCVALIFNKVKYFTKKQ